MKETDSEDTFFREIISKSKLDIPFSDFDDNVMKSLTKRYSTKTSLIRDIKISWLFFTLGLILGIMIPIVLPRFVDSFLGIPLDKIALPFLIILSFVLLTQFDSLMNATKRLPK